MPDWRDLFIPPDPDPDRFDPDRRMRFAVLITILALLAYTLAATGPEGGWYLSLTVGKSAAQVADGRRAYSVRVGTLPASTSWPDESNTGVPAGVTLTDYTGPCTITVDNTVIDRKIINCESLLIQAQNVVITNSRLFGEVYTYENSTHSVSLTDSEVINGARQACMCVGPDNFTMLRVEVVGGNRGVYCRFHCDVRDSYIHGTEVLTLQHASAVRVEQYATLVHNTLWCSYDGIAEPGDVDTGCSADMTGYPDFAPIMHNTIQGNFFRTNGQNGTIGYCAYGGGTLGKTYTNDPNNATYIVFKDNVWEKGPNGTCGAFGPIADYVPGTGNVWSNNKFDDGTVINP